MHSLSKGSRGDNCSQLHRLGRVRDRLVMAAGPMTAFACACRMVPARYPLPPLPSRPTRFKTRSASACRMEAAKPEILCRMLFEGKQSTHGPDCPTDDRACSVTEAPAIDSFPPTPAPDRGNLRVCVSALPCRNHQNVLKHAIRSSVISILPLRFRSAFGTSFRRGAEIVTTFETMSPHPAAVPTPGAPELHQRQHEGRADDEPKGHRQPPRGRWLTRSANQRRKPRPLHPKPSIVKRQNLNIDPAKVVAAEAKESPRWSCSSEYEPHVGALRKIAPVRGQLPCTRYKSELLDVVRDRSDHPARFIADARGNQCCERAVAANAEAMRMRSYRVGGPGAGASGQDVRVVQTVQPQRPRRQTEHHRRQSSQVEQAMFHLGAPGFQFLPSLSHVPVACAGDILFSLLLFRRMRLDLKSPSGADSMAHSYLSKHPPHRRHCCHNHYWP